MTKEAFDEYFAQLKAYKFEQTQDSHAKGLELYQKIKEIPTRRGFFRSNDYRRFSRQLRLGTQVEKKLKRLAQLLTYDLANKKIRFDVTPYLDKRPTPKKKRKKRQKNPKPPKPKNPNHDP